MKHEFDYATAGVAVREEIKDAHRFIWRHICSPGTWWSGSQRVAMAAETRRATTCALCRRRKAALAPNSIPGPHDTPGVLPESVVELIHRVRTDPARLSRAWFDGVLAKGLTDAEYVEVVGVVTLLTGVDFFALALGVAPEPLPEPLPGAPSRHRPGSAKSGTAWVPLIAPEDADGPEADVYAGLPLVPNIVRALSLVPDQARALQRSSNAHYLPVAQIADPTVRRGLDRPQMELVAARVSALNECFY